MFNKISRALGVEPGLGFFDVYSLDPDLLALIPRPVHALLFTCPHEVYMRVRNETKEPGGEYQGSGPEEPVMWFRQTIGNACGLIALLHGLSNGGAKEHIRHGSELDKLLQKAIPLQPEERASVLYNSQELEVAHKAGANIGDTQAPSADLSPGNHFICFAKGEDGHLWELCGGEKGPHDRGTLGEHEDALSERALELGVRTFMKHAGTWDLNFSMVALASGVVD